MCSVVFLQDFSQALHPQYEAALHTALLDIYYEHPGYRLGAPLSDDKWIDCSLVWGRAAFKANIPDMEYRPTAYSIYKGKGGWENKPVDFKDLQRVDAVALAIPPKKGGLIRPEGVNHIMAVVEWNGVPMILHASSSAGTVVIVPYATWMANWLAPNGLFRFLKGDK